jgi:hypothetical protein
MLPLEVVKVEQVPLIVILLLVAVAVVQAVVVQKIAQELLVVQVVALVLIQAHQVAQEMRVLTHLRKAPQVVQPLVHQVQAVAVALLLLVE